MLVDMYNDDPTEYSGLSHVITKFRQSFSWLWNRKRNYLNLI
jgi:hypothetical protein